MMPPAFLKDPTLEMPRQRCHSSLASRQCAGAGRAKNALSAITTVMDYYMGNFPKFYMIMYI
jgi:hypothetical protein